MDLLLYRVVITFGNSYSILLEFSEDKYSCHDILELLYFILILFYFYLFSLV